MQVEIKRLGINGEGIGYIDKKAIFVDFCLPGEVVEVEITEDNATFYKGKLIKIITPSKERETPFCPVYFECGGCQLQHVKYKEQLNQKRELIIQALKRYTSGKVKFGLVEQTIGMENPKHYRNKASLPIMYVGKRTEMGLFKPGSNHFVPFEACPIQNEDVNKVYRLILNQMEKRKIEASNHGGTVRFIVVRKTHYNKETQVSFIVTKSDKKLHELGKYLVEKFSEVKSVYEVINADFKSRDFFTEHQKLIAGTETINETLGGITYHLKIESFFQLNTEIAEKMYEHIIKIGDFKKNETVIDAFGGVGPLAFYIAPYVNKVYSIDRLASNINSLEKTIKENEVTNITPLLGDVKTVLNSKKISANTLIFDPPRAGLGKAFTDFLLKHKPNKLIYVSCNPSTLAKDLSELLSAYEVKRIVPFDMFPHTAQVESVTLLSLK